MTVLNAWYTPQQSDIQPSERHAKKFGKTSFGTTMGYWSRQKRSKWRLTLSAKEYRSLLRENVLEEIRLKETIGILSPIENHFVSIAKWLQEDFHRGYSATQPGSRMSYPKREAWIPWGMGGPHRFQMNIRVWYISSKQSGFTGRRQRWHKEWLMIPSRFRIEGKKPLKDPEVTECSGVGVNSFAQFVML